MNIGEDEVFLTKTYVCQNGFAKKNSQLEIGCLVPSFETHESCLARMSRWGLRMPKLLD